MLDGLGVDDLHAAGHVQSFAFLLDMNRLFERFIHRYIERVIPADSYRVRSQRVDRSIVREANTDRPYARVVPDLLVESRDGCGTRLAIDAKYKAYDEKRLAPPDAYQSFLYAFAYGERTGEAPWWAVLMYPSSTGQLECVRLHLRRGRTVDAEITAVGVPIPTVLDEAQQGCSGPASDAVLSQLRLVRTNRKTGDARRDDRV